MELRQMRYFLAVAEELHFGRAAAKLHIAEQPLGQQIRKLEEELGARLLERTTRSVSLTPAGDAFMEEARKILEQSDRTVDLVRRIGAGKAGVVRMGYETSVAMSLMPEFVQRFRSAYPDIELILCEHSTLGLPDLEKGSTDACLVIRFERLPKWAEYIPVQSDKVVVALPPDHPLTSREAITSDDLRGERLLSYTGPDSERANMFLANIAAAFDQGADVRREAGSYQALLGLVAANMGVTIVTESLARMFSGRIAFRPLASPLIKVDSGLALRKDDPSPIAESLRLTAGLLARQLI